MVCAFIFLFSLFEEEGKRTLNCNEIHMLHQHKGPAPVSTDDGMKEPEQELSERGCRCWIFTDATCHHRLTPAELKPEGDTSFCPLPIEQMMPAFDGRASR